MTVPVTWVMPALDAAVLLMLGALFWRLRRDPLAAWEAHGARLRESFERLQVLAAQSEGIARELDATLGAREERLRALVGEATAAARRALEDATPPARDDVVAQVRRLAAAALPVEEIARRTAMPAAEVRVLVGLQRDGRAAARPRTVRA